MDDLVFDIRISTKGRPLVALEDFRLRQGKITFLFGESGIGKSLCSLTVYGLLDPDVFDVTINQQPYRAYLESASTKEIRKNGFFVFQEPSSHLNPLSTLGDQLNEGSLADAPDETGVLHALWDNPPQNEIEGLLQVYPKPHRPSGGEKQRMLLAMALKKLDAILSKQTGLETMLLVFDEPTGSLDNHFRDVFVSLLLQRFQHARFTVLVITHDYSMIGLIMTRYQDQIKNVVFEELDLRGDRLHLREFDPGKYLGWLKKLQPHVSGNGDTGAPLLQVESGPVVYGRELLISADPDGSNACSLKVFPGRLTYLKARSGVGKTTLLKTVMGLTGPQRFDARLGKVRLTHKTTKSFWREKIWGKKLTMVFQHADEALNPHSRVKEVFDGLPGRRKPASEEIRAQLAGFFDDDLGSQFLDKQVMMLSGGQKQRLNLARAFSLETDVLLLDEPLNGLDFDSMTRVLGLLQQKQDEGKGLLLVSHNEEILSELIHEADVYYLHASEKAKVQSSMNERGLKTLSTP